jgi:hypothetical protein
MRLKPTLTLALLASLLAPAAAQAKRKPEITVMTRNVFLGADLGPVLNATSIPQAIDGAGLVWNELQRTRFAVRAVPLAQ